MYLFNDYSLLSTFTCVTPRKIFAKYGKRFSQSIDTANLRVFYLHLKGKRQKEEKMSKHQ